MALVDKLRRAREFQVETGGFTFTLRRPTDVEWLELVESGKSTARTVLAYIVGWEGVKEIDLIPGGDPHPLPFDAVASSVMPVQASPPGNGGRGLKHEILRIPSGGAGGRAKKLRSWLEQQQLPPQLRPATPDTGTGLAIRVWNTLGGLDWAGLETACDVFGVYDIDLMIHRLVAIRDFQAEQES